MPAPRSRVTVNDTLPTTAGLAWTIDPDPLHRIPAGASSTGVLKYGPAPLASGGSAKVRIISPTTPATCPSVHNQAFLTYIGGSGDDSGDILVDCPDIQVTKTADKTPINAGETASFTITVENIGIGTAYGVTLTDILPAGVTWGTDNTDCQISSGTLSCNFGDLDPGDPQTVVVSGPTVPAVCTPLVNTATASSTNEPSDLLANNTDGDTIVVDCPSISLTKVAVDPSVNATDGVAFDIVLSNAGPGAAANVAVTDPLPTTAGTTWTIDAANSDAGWTIDAGALKYTAASLAAGASVKVRIVSGTTAASCGDIDNTATVTFDGGTTSASDTITVSCPDLVLTKTADNSPILAGQIASFTISVSNQGLGTAYGVTITDNLSAGSWQVDSQACSIDAGVLSCFVGSLAPNAEPFTVHLSRPTDVPDCGTLPNQATVSATNEPDDVLGNNTAGDQVDVQCASIELVKTAGNAADGAILTIPVPGNVTFTYVVTNTGTSDLQDIALVDDNATPTNTADDITIVCPSTTLEAGESMTCTASIPVNGLGITRTNVATVTAVPVLNTESTVTATDNAVVKVPAPVITPPQDHPSAHVDARRGHAEQRRHGPAAGPPRHRRADAGHGLRDARAGQGPVPPAEPEGLGPSRRGRSKRRPRNRTAVHELGSPRPGRGARA